MILGQITLNIPGVPIAKKRPRFARRGKCTVAYSDQKTEEGRFLWEVRTQHAGEQLLGALHMELEFVFPRPKSHYGTGRNADILKKSAPIHHIKKPDNDNLQKFVKDCLNGEAYHDDSQIVIVIAKKRFVRHGEKPTTIVLIKTINETEG